MLQDLRYALRVLVQNRNFTAVAVLALALGIGANTAMFSIVYAVLLKPLPYKDPGRLVWITEFNTRFKMGVVAAPDFIDWRAQTASFEAMAGYLPTDQTLSSVADPVSIRTLFLSEPLTRLLGVAPARGRDFTEDEVRNPAAPRVVLISDHLLQSRFAGNPSAIGQTLVLGGAPVTVIGVMPRDFRLALPALNGAQLEAEAIIPFTLNPATDNRSARNMRGLQVIARLRPGTAMATARADLETVRARIPEGQIPRAVRQLKMTPLSDRILGDTGKPLLVLLGAVAFVLAIACANVANLLMARAAGRSRETAVRLALGAARGRLIRQFLTESLTLSAAGGLAGVALAWIGVRLIVNWSPVVVPRLRDASVNPLVLAFAIALTLLTGVLFGIAPAISGSGANVNLALRESGSPMGSSSRRPLRGALIVVEVALAMMLLGGAGLMVKSLWVMRSSTALAQPDQVLTSGLQMATPRFRDVAGQPEFLAGYLGGIESIPGVRAAAVYSGDRMGMSNLAGMPPRRPGDEVRTETIDVTTHYFEAAGLRLLAGRLFADSDRAGAPPVAIVNAAFARRFFPDFPHQTPVGRQFPPSPVDPGAQPNTIVGVVADLRLAALDTEVTPLVFVPALQVPYRSPNLNLIARAVSDPMAVVGAIRQQDRQVNLVSPQSLEDRLTDSIAPKRFQMALLVIFASLAVMLALVGIYGVVSYSVMQRTREIGIRVTLGAQRGEVIGLILAGGLKLAAAGLLLGLAGSFALARVMASLLYGVKPTDALTLSAVGALLIVVAAVAAWIPARRASAIDPTIALRYE